MPLFCLTSPWRAAAGVAARISDRYSIWQIFRCKSGLHMRARVSLKSPSDRAPVGFVNFFTLFCSCRPAKREYRICCKFIRISGLFDNKLSKSTIFLAFFHKKNAYFSEKFAFFHNFCYNFRHFLLKKCLFNTLFDIFNKKCYNIVG